MPDIGVPELLIILLVVLVVFGPTKLADIGGSLGRGIREFRRGMKDEDEQPAPPAAPVAPEQRAVGAPPAAPPPAGQQHEPRQ